MNYTKYLSAGNLKNLIDLERQAFQFKSKGIKIPHKIKAQIDALHKMAHFLYDTRKLS